MAKDAVKSCSICSICKFTRNTKKENLFYKIAGAIQKMCPDCKAANATTSKNFQKSLYIK